MCQLDAGEDNNSGKTCFLMSKMSFVLQARLLVRTLGLVREFRDVEGEPI